VGPLVIVDVAVVVPEERASKTESNISRANSSSRALPLKLSTKGVSQGLPGAM
jgi:hypothetical protein